MRWRPGRPTPAEGHTGLPGPIAGFREVEGRGAEEGERKKGGGIKKRGEEDQGKWEGGKERGGIGKTPPS